jgi:hypothetical protein
MIAEDAWHRCRGVDVGGTVVCIRTTDSDRVARLDDLFAAFPDGDPAAWDRPEGGWRGPRKGAGIDVRLMALGDPETDKDERRYELWVGRHMRVQSRQLWRHEDRILGNLNRWVLDAQPDLVHIHAAVVSSGDSAAALIGPTGSGKSTLCAQLVSDGFAYLTDETISLHPTTGLLHPFPRPLTLKRGSWPFFDSLPSVPGDDASAARNRAHIPPAELGAIASGPMPPRVVALLRHGADETSVVDIDPAEALEALVADCLDLERAGIAGMRALVELAASTRTVRLEVADLSEASAAVGELMAQPVPDRSVEYLAPVGGAAPTQVVGPSDVVVRSGTAHGWLFDDTGVLYDTDRGAMLRIDAAAGDLWRAFDGQRPLADAVAPLAAEGHQEVIDEALGFARTLTGYGLVEVVAGP